MLKSVTQKLLPLFTAAAGVLGYSSAQAESVAQGSISGTTTVDFEDQRSLFEQKSLVPPGVLPITNFVFDDNGVAIGGGSKSNLVDGSAASVTGANNRSIFYLADMSHGNTIGISLANTNTFSALSLSIGSASVGNGSVLLPDGTDVSFMAFDNDNNFIDSYDYIMTSSAFNTVTLPSSFNNIAYMFIMTPHVDNKLDMVGNLAIDDFQYGPAGLVVPEPNGAAMLAAGGLMLAGLSRFRGKSAALTHG